MKKITLLIFITQTFFCFSQSVRWDYDKDIAGTFLGHRSGYDVCLNADGSKVAIGYNSTAYSPTYSVRVFEKNNDDWQLYGQELFAKDFGLTDGDSVFGNQVELSSDGNTLIISGVHKVLILKHNITNNLWELFSVLEHDSDMVTFTNAITLSNNGEYLAVSGRYDNEDAHGYVDIYEIKESVLVGVDSIDGNSTFFGQSLGINDDGTILTVGNHRDEMVEDNAGAVYIYKKSVSNNYILEEDLYGSVENQSFGRSMFLNSSGDVLAVGSYDNNVARGSVAVYQKNEGSWELKGSVIKSLVDNSSFGTSVSLTVEGNRLVIGSPGDSATDRGVAQIYDYLNNDDWSYTGYVAAKESDDNLGISVDISNNGSVVVAGSILNDDNGSSSGHVRIYSDPQGTLSILTNTIDGLVLDVDHGKILANLDDMVLEVYTVLGQKIINDSLKSGIYIVVAKNLEGKIQRFKILVK